MQKNVILLAKYSLLLTVNYPPAERISYYLCYTSLDLRN